MAAADVPNLPFTESGRTIGAPSAFASAAWRLGERPAGLGPRLTTHGLGNGGRRDAILDRKLGLRDATFTVARTDCPYLLGVKAALVLDLVSLWLQPDEVARRIVTPVAAAVVRMAACWRLAVKGGADEPGDEMRA